ncbi:nuclear movement protein, putative [Plasmodium gallinaceum]|uniref:Nuclear migration protein nudC n=1 Tax=Plasmodium gallinaceum TaxID=5849 RepID=A0A1J1GS24_PLAGA|nr:nuclear movement protein, putative [Plasmodium gallinaceum]CRG95078.1 nuclear movement protein, putative [Plasmodium gallinaceum]
MDPNAINEKFDFFMLNFARECGDINNLLNHFFYFLLRKTDFILKSKNLEQCEEIVLKNLRKQYAKKEKYMAELKKEQIKESECKENTVNSNLKKNKETEKNDNKVKDEKKNTKINENKQKNDDNKKEKKKSNSADSDDSLPPKDNGGITDKYRWIQTTSSLEMFIDAKEKIKTKDIKVDITYKKLFVKIKDKVIIDGEFYKKIKPEGSIWTLEDNQIIHILIEKLHTMEWWATAIKGDAEIDVKKIVPENSRMDDLDPETRAVVEKMLYDQRQKSLNLPTSDEQKKYEIFEKFKKMHPELDFSNANINFGNSSNNIFSGK